MNITDVRVKLAPGPHGPAEAPVDDGAANRLLAFCAITIDACFVVRDLRLIRGSGGPFVAMPSRKITARCDDCGGKTPLRAKYCGECGAAQNGGPDEVAVDRDGRTKLHADVAHPINPSCRAMVHAEVLAAYERERSLAADPGYVCRFDEPESLAPPHRSRSGSPARATVGRRAFADGL